MDVIAIINAQVITPYELIKDGVILIKDSNIVALGNKEEFEILNDCQIIDANGLFVGPGFIDIHNHGGGGYWAHENPIAVAKYHMKFGTTGLLPTLAYFLNKDELQKSVELYVETKKNNNKYSDLLLGIHLEGPFLNPKYGAITSEIRKVDREEYKKLLEIAGKHIKIWTIAPEMEGQEELVKYASTYNDIVFSVGHSEATPEQIFPLVPKGLNLACHFSNATGVTPHPSRFDGTRELGVDEAVLLHENIKVEVIPDRAGIHVRPLMIQLLVKVKGIEKVIIITDAMKDAGLETKDEDTPESIKGFKNYGDLNFTNEGELNGSLLTMNKAVRNMMRHTGINIIDAFRMASTNPARLLGLDSMLGSLEVGKKANLIFVDEEMNVHRVFFQGEQIFNVNKDEVSKKEMAN